MSENPSSPGLAETADVMRRLRQLEYAAERREQAARRIIPVLKLFNWGMAAYFVLAAISWVLAGLNIYFGLRGSHQGAPLDVSYVLAFFLSMQMLEALQNDVARGEPEQAATASA